MSEDKRKGGSARAALGRSGRSENIKRSLGRGGSSPLEARESQETSESQEANRELKTDAERTNAKTRTKRITVDLPIPEHRFLRDFAYDQETDGMRVVRALLAELAHDPDLATRIRARLAGE